MVVSILNVERQSSEVCVPIDTDDTSHDDRDDVLDDQVGTQNTHCGDADAGLGRAIGGAEAGEDYGGRAAHGSEEGL